MKIIDHKGIYALFGVLATLIVGLIIVIVMNLIRAVAPPYNPLYFPGQHVATAQIHIGQDVIVTATRCNRSKDPVTYRAIKSWVSVDPSGSTIVVGESEATEQPGCTNFTFTNPMPPLVVSRTQGLLSTGLKAVVWKITATDIPEGHPNPGSVTWETTPIVVTQ